MKIISGKLTENGEYKISIDLNMAAHHPEVPEIEDECPICLSELTPEKLPSMIDGCCGYKFCLECLEKWVEKGGRQVTFFEIFF